MLRYVIRASTPETSVAVCRDDAADALDKMRDFEDLGSFDIAVVTATGMPISREELRRLARDQAKRDEAASESAAA